MRPVYLVAAMDKNHLIGRGRDLPWGRTLKADLRRFKNLTRGQTVVMGRATFESIGRPLSERENIVLTADRNFSAAGAVIKHSLATILAMPGRAPLWVIGGRSTYQQFLPFADKMFLTFIEHELDGDAYFPPVVWAEWRLIEETTQPAGPDSPWLLRFTVWERLHHVTTGWDKPPPPDREDQK